MAYLGSGGFILDGEATSNVIYLHEGSGGLRLGGSAITNKKEFELLNFTPISKNRSYNLGLDENNKYPEDYNENYSDILRS